MGCKPRHYPRRASRALFLDNNYVHQANGFSHNDIYQANSASSDSSLSLSMIDEEIVDEDFCEWIIRELSQLDDGSAHLERANHSLNLTDGPGVADAAAVSFVDVAAINSPMPQVSSHANTPGTGTVIVTQQY